MRHANQGKRAVILFLVQRSDARSFAISNVSDPAYAVAFEAAVKAGVSVVALIVSVSRTGFGIPQSLPNTCNSTSSLASMC